MPRWRSLLRSAHYAYKLWLIRTCFPIIILIPVPLEAPPREITQPDSLQFGSVQLAGGTVKPVEISRFWVESGMNKHILLEQISNGKCQSSPLYLQACWSALKVAMKELDERSALRTDDFESAIEQVDQSHALHKPKEQVFGEMFTAFLRVFDPHAFFLPHQAVRTMLSAESGSHYGTGIRVIATGAGLMVRDVYKNSPAKTGGLQVNDRIVKIKGAQVKEGMNSRESIEWISGKQGESIHFTVERDGAQRELRLRIDVIDDPIVSHETFQVGNDHYAFIALNGFRDLSCVQLRSEIENLGNQLRGLILDLRYNPGGELDEAVCIAGLFAGKKEVVGTKAIPLRIPVEGYGPLLGPSTIQWRRNFRAASFEKMQVVVLIDAGSASASEIVAAALQDQGAAWVVGERSFGKGTVQSVQDFTRNRNFKIGFTNAFFYRPNGTANQLVGVMPDFEIPFRRGASAEERRSPHENDLYWNAQEEGDHSQPTRGPRPEAAILRQCVESDGRDVTAMAIVKKKIGFEDYQRAYALALLGCVNQIKR